MATRREVRCNMSLMSAVCLAASLIVSTQHIQLMCVRLAYIIGAGKAVMSTTQEGLTHSYKPIPGVHNPVVGHVQINRVVPHSLLPPLQLLGRSSHLRDYQCWLIVIAKW